jgi:hypothetical protein
MKMMTLLIELLKSNELPELAIGGAWAAIHNCLTGRPSLGPAAVECGVFELAVAQLNAIGSPADWISISRGKAGRAQGVLSSISDVAKCFAGQASRPDLAACVASSLFNLCIEAVAAVGSAGANGLSDTRHGVLYSALTIVRNTRAQPRCEAKIRSVAGALSFCLMNELDHVQELGATTAATAASICESPSCFCAHRTVRQPASLNLLRIMRAQAVACSGGMKVDLSSPLRRSTLNFCKQMQCGLLRLCADPNTLCWYIKQARKVVADGASRRILRCLEAQHGHHHGSGALRIR